MSESVRGPAPGAADLTRGRRPWRTRLAPLWLALGSCVVTALVLLAAEHLARAGDPGYLSRVRGAHVFSSIYGWSPRPSSTTLVEGKRVRFNARGFRGRELGPRVPGGNTRVVILGDSVAFGLGVEDTETFAQLLDARENGLEAANLAVQGYGPGQELLVLRHEGLRVAPDVVVLAFCAANDLADALLTVSLYDGVTPTPRFRLEGSVLVLEDENLRPGHLRRLQRWLGDYSQLFNRLTGGPAAAPPAGAAALQHWRRRKHDALVDEEYALRLNVALVRRMAELCRQRGIRFVVATFPSFFSWEERPWLSRRYQESLEAEGIRVVDMASRFQARGLSFDAIALDAVGHLTPLGHEVSADVLEEALTGSPGRRSP